MAKIQKIKPLFRSGFLFLFWIIWESLFFPLQLFASNLDEAIIQNHSGVLRAQKNDLEGAIKAFEQAFQADPRNETIISNLATAYNNKGVLLVKTHKYTGALELFQKAKCLKPEDIEVRFNFLAALIGIRDFDQARKEARRILLLRPNEPRTLLKLATVFQKMEDLDLAQNLFERLLEIDPENVSAFLNLGYLFYNSRNFSEARYAAQRVLETSPQNASATNLLQRIIREEEVEDGFESQNSTHFTISFENEGHKEWISDLLDFFEEAYDEVGEKLQFFPQQRTQVIVYSRSQFHQLSPQTSSLPTWAGGLYDGKIRLPIPHGLVNPNRLKGAVFHEYCHHLVHFLSSGRCPTWLNEGLAQLVEGIELNTAIRLLKTAKKYFVVPLRKITTSFSKTETRDIAECLYSQSLITVSLIESEIGIQGIRAILECIAQGNSIEDALSAVLGKTCETLDREVKEVLEKDIPEE